MTNAISQAEGASEKRFALALSGGGFRALYFHLGVVKFLRDAGLLSQVSCVTAVSGGSIMAAHLVLHWEKYTGSERDFQTAADQLIALGRLDLRGRIVRRLIAGLGLRSPTELLRRYLERHVFGKATLSDWGNVGPRPLQRGSLRQLTRRLGWQGWKKSDVNEGLQPKPMVFVVATNLTRGVPTAFSCGGIHLDARKPEELLRSPLLPVALAVSASSAYPALFYPVRLSAEQLGVADHELTPPVQYLTDGAVFDNSASEVLSNVVGKDDADLFIISDASHDFDFDTRNYGLISGLVRTYDVTMNAAASHQRARLESRIGIPLARVAISEHLPVERAQVPIVDQRLTSRIRTDLDRFDDVEVGSLIRHGYALAAQAFPSCQPKPEVGGFKKAFSLKGDFWAEGRQRNEVLSRAGRIKLRLFSWRDPILLVPAILATLLVTVSFVNLALSIREEWLFRSGQSLTLEQVTSLIGGPGQDRDRLLFRRGVMNNLLSMAFEPLPIMGTAAATRSVVLDEHTTLFVQGANKLIKLQRFDLPAGPKQIRAQSRQTVGATGDIATVWTWIERPDGSLHRLDPPFSTAWQILESEPARYFYVLALYDTGLFTQPGEFSGAEIDDLAGKILNVRFMIAGRVANVKFQDLFQFPNVSPLQFFRHGLDASNVLSGSRELSNQSFARLIQEARLSLNQSGTERLGEAISVWDEVQQDATNSWFGLQMTNVRYDYIVVLTGNRN